MDINDKVNLGVTTKSASHLQSFSFTEDWTSVPWVSKWYDTWKNYAQKREMRENRERGEKVGFTQRKHWLFSWGEEVISGSLSLSFSFLFRIISSSLVFNSGNVFLPFFPFFFALFFSLLFSSFFKPTFHLAFPRIKTTRGPDGGPYLLRCQNHVWFIPSLFEVLQRGISSLLSIVVHRLNQTLTSEIWNLGKRSGKE